MDCPVGGEAVVHPLDPGFAGVDPETASDDEGTAELELEGEYWRREVAARVQRYRTRRKPRPPRYPSLRLPFDSVENRSVSRTSVQAPIAGLATASAVPLEPELEIETPQESAFCSAASQTFVEEPGLFSNVIEFPRSAVVPAFRGDELAEPVLDRPRIVEAPEVLPPPPALGGILMDPGIRPEAQTNPNDDVLRPAALPKRLLAGLLDGLVLTAALAAFAGIFLWVNAERPPVPLAIASGVGMWALFWAAYKFLFLVYTGSTPGLWMARLRLARFDGAPVNRSVRRWRVLASYLSALSLGLGYFWCVLDEDSLCWHDRMTRTHLL